MKILRLLNKKYFSIILFFLFGFNSFAEEQPADIWNIDKEKIEESDQNNSIIQKSKINDQTSFESNVYNMQTETGNNIVELDQNINSESIKIIGLYDPEDNGLDINMWSNTDGDQIKKIFLKLDKLNLSQDATEIMNILMLTNSYNPKINISEKEFLKFRSKWLIKNSNLKIIEEYLIKNQIVDTHVDLTRFLVDTYLSMNLIDEACNIFLKNSEPIKDEYLSKFNIYCLIVSKKNEEAQLILDLKKELGFKDKYFEEKINYLLGYNSKVENSISDKSILNFHLAHKTNPEFAFEPDEKTNKIIWKYLSSSNLFNIFQEINISELDKISTLEKAAHNKNYPEKDLFELYKRFQFNINQLLNAHDAYKPLTSIEARALVYQRILLESEMVERLKLLKILKKLFKKDNLGNAFDIELKRFLKDINPTEIPDNLTSFYYTNIKIDNNSDKKIKFNNNILHQSKLLNYFNGDYAKSKIEKDINNFLKKIKKDKKYFLSKKDVIFLESLRFDGIEISKKYENLYDIDNNEVPTDIQIMINNNEKGMALLRIVEVIGQDDLERIDEDTVYFIISILNQLNIDPIRNKILFKVLPLKV
tara:strand:- start:1 stop:1773 length:1773 start_codon:yes stop_codon:yes gene_type:complete